MPEKVGMMVARWLPVAVALLLTLVLSIARSGWWQGVLIVALGTAVAWLAPRAAEGRHAAREFRQVTTDLRRQQLAAEQRRREAEEARALAEAAQERAEAGRERAEADRAEADAAREAADERALIGPEMHDLVSNAIGVMVVLAEGGPAAVESRPQAAERAFDTIAGTGRRTLAELGGMLSVLRHDIDPGQRAVPGLADLPELVRIMRAAGMALTLVAPEDVRLGRREGLAVYRVVQEALTNALNHAPGQPVEVRLEVVDARLVATVSNPVPPRRGPEPPAGHGVRSMRERAESVRGELSAAEDEGRWQVRLAVPVEKPPKPASSGKNRRSDKGGKGTGRKR
ncbi:signal transduction histidine kinase [Catenuloplanes nepalensis]|uniref:histidine kinase n=1 Tax=Catenuloplanes nepalensis TaxID=587533 RepID=A0ABT9N3T4_9ACTN|nr:sensor histidine kinase [Catenuloplanes nepalensis]MDP9798168.1 signal transduction histidine kinase [Catenuloplanes nepalensis]